MVQPDNSGAVRAEFAHIFSAFGTRVTIIEMKPRILSAEEEEISSVVTTEFENNGISVLTNNKLLLRAERAIQKH